MSQPYKFNVDLELLKKYGRPGPRYTSYPTAPHFHKNFTGQTFKEAIIESNQGENLPPLSLYFHLPFCKTLCYYCGCNMLITHSPEKIDQYLQWLKKELLLIRPLVNPHRKVMQLHWGGGSPDYLSPSQIEFLFQTIEEIFPLDEDAELGIEIDPRRLTPEHLPLLRKLGFNRISFGVQDFHPKVQEAVNRIQPEELTRQVIADARAVGFDSINMDLIYGLPYQTAQTYKETLAKIIELNPHRLAVFNYAHVPWMKKHQQTMPEEALPSSEERLNMLKLIIETLTEAGYVYIGMDHFARADDPLSLALKNHTLYRNFQGYTTWKSADIYAFGITSISQLESCYAQNVKALAPYEKLLDQGKIPTMVGYSLSKDDQLRREVISQLMCNNRVDKRVISETYGIDFDDYFRESLEKLAPFVEDDLMTITGDSLEVGEPGRLIIRNMAMAFDAYLKGDGKNMYSKTI